MLHFRMTFAALAFTISGSCIAHAQLLDTQAEFAVIMDFDSGEVLFDKQGNDLMIPASMTKIMTAHVVFERLRTGELSLDDRFTVSENAWAKGGWATGGSTMGLKIGETLTVEDLLRGVIILSGNDACIVLAEGISGSEEAFAREMTDLARRMGLASATFKNASGLDDDGHRISAIDLAKLAKAEIETSDDLYRYYSEPEMTWNSIRQFNRNPLLGKMDGVDGLKTGHLSVSGYGLTATAIRNGARRIIVINGLPSSATRALEAERLMRLAFDAFETREITTDDKRLAELDVWMGNARTVGVKLSEGAKIVAHKRAFEMGTTQIVYNGPIEAPIAAGDKVAELIITLEGKDPVTLPLVAIEDVGRLGFLEKAIEGLARKLEPAAP
jgi:D-alanyl-D-alanine carboxypeptidase (penicillin-binding protein 5/6)